MVEFDSSRIVVEFDSTQILGYFLAPVVEFDSSQELVEFDSDQMMQFHCLVNSGTHIICVYIVR